MFRPAITDIVNTLKNPVGMFRTLTDVELYLDLYGEPLVAVSDGAAVFDCRVEGVEVRLKVALGLGAEILREGEKLLRQEMYVYTLSGDEGWVDVILLR